MGRALLTAGIGLLLTTTTNNALALTLTRDGVSNYAIVVAQEAPPPDQTAARELQNLLEQVTGAKLPVRTENEVAAEAPQLVVGAPDRMGRVLPEVRVSELRPDAIVMKTVGDTIVLTGQPPRGTLYAVYTFLEDVVGCRWWTSTEATIPKKPTLQIPDLDTVYAPPLMSREALYYDAQHSPFAVRLKHNGHFTRIPPEYGGKVEIIGFCHTFFRFLPPDKYFEARPEWYAEIDGRRTANGAQLCLTNESMRREFSKNALARLREENDPRIISISQNDGHGQCQCAACGAQEEAEGSPSGPLIHFVNAIAAEIEREFPEVLVETLAYSYTRRPPEHVRPRHNVLVRLVSTDCCFSHPLAAGPENAGFRNDVEQWAAIAPQLYVWLYAANYRNFLLPHPNMRTMGHDIRYLASNNTLGLFEQGDEYTTTGDFLRLRAWVLAHLMWDPSRDQQELIREFIEGYYGPAAPPLLKYLESVHDAVAASGIHLRCIMDDTSSWMTLESLNEATKLFGEARAAVADDPLLRERVEREQLPLDLVWLNRYYSLQDEAEREATVSLGPTDPAAALETWVDRQKRFGNDYHAEGHKLDTYVSELRNRLLVDVK